MPRRLLPLLLLPLYCSPVYGSNLLISPQLQEQSKSLTLPNGYPLYVIAMATGGGYPVDGFKPQNASIISLKNARGIVCAQLALTTSPSAQFSTRCKFYCIGGCALTPPVPPGSPAHFAAIYNTAIGPASPRLALSFKLKTPAFILAIGLSADQNIEILSGLPGLQTDTAAPVLAYAAIGQSLAHAHLNPGAYTLHQMSMATSANRPASAWANILAIIALPDDPNTAPESILSSPSPQIPWPPSILSSALLPASASPSLLRLAPNADPGIPMFIWLITATLILLTVLLTFLFALTKRRRRLQTSNIPKPQS